MTRPYAAPHGTTRLVPTSKEAIADEVEAMRAKGHLVDRDPRDETENPMLKPKIVVVNGRRGDFVLAQSPNGRLGPSYVVGDYLQLVPFAPDVPVDKPAEPKPATRDELFDYYDSRCRAGLADDSQALDEKPTLKVGSVVRLRSGGPEMTVTGIMENTESEIFVTWFMPEGVIQHMAFSAAALTVLRP